MMRTLMVLLMLGAAAPLWSSGDNPIYAPDGIAIEGYDPVAYFTEGAAVEGDPRFAWEWNGAVWHFSSEAYLRLFRENPEMYAPAYGGYCAWAVAQGDVAGIDPEQWTIQDGRLFLNYSGFIQWRFNLRLGDNIRSADENWPSVRTQIEQ